MALIWIIVIILLLIVEAMTVNLTTIWFVISGIISLILSFFVDNYLIQFGIFITIGTLLFIITRPILKKIIKERKDINKEN